MNPGPTYAWNLHEGLASHSEPVDVLLNIFTYLCFKVAISLNPPAKLLINHREQMSPFQYATRNKHVHYTVQQKPNI